MNRFKGWTEKDILRLIGETKKLRDNNKFNSRKTEYKDKKFDSAYEVEIAMELDWRISAGVIRSYERQVKIPLTVNGVHICNHFMDFVITHNDNSKEYLEAKGYATQLWKLKKKLFLALYSNVKHTTRYKKEG